MFKSVKNPEKAWEFIKWWTSTQTQTWFGNRQESLLGASGRYTPANINVISKLPWNQEQLDVLQSQVDFIQTLPQIPGSYFLGRALNNAFLTTVLSGGNAREELLKWNEQVNMELERKRLEFDFKPTSYR
jgi:ABC-type glycerol-3-phosphate transport system substrate-binding protein